MAITSEELRGTIQKHRSTYGLPNNNNNNKISVFRPHLLVELANVKIPHSFDGKLDMNVYITNSIDEWKVSIMRS